jgi:type IV pilus assembly protein PilM
VALAVTGADLGASGLRVLRLASRGGQLEVVAGASTELPLRTPPVRIVERRKTVRLESESPEDSPEHIREVRTNLASLLRQGPFRSGRSVLGLNASAGLIRYLQVPPVPPWKMDMMMKYEVEEQMATQERSAFDYRILDLPDVGGQLTVMLAMIQERRLRTLMDTARRAGLPRGDVDLTALAIYNAYIHGHGVEEGRSVLLVDIGAETMDIVIVNDGLMCFARSVPGGGSRFTAAVAEVTGVTFEEAEQLKREKGRILGSEESEAEDLPEVRKKISAVLTRELGVLAGVLDSSLMYCRAQTKQAKLRPEEVLISGGGAMLPGLEEALARRMRMRVSRLEPFRKISLGGLNTRDVEEISGQAPRYAVALGLAASRLVPNSVGMSMVPEDVKTRRKFLDSGLWMWYATACLFLVSGLLFWVPMRNRGILQSEHDKLNDLVKTAGQDSRKFAEGLALTRQRCAEVKTLEERVHSGRDIYQVLGLLRKCARGDFRSKILVVETTFRAPSKAAPLQWERASGLSFQTARRVFIRGYSTVDIKDANNDAELRAADKAVALIKKYRLELQKQGQADGIVREVKPRYTQADADEKFREKNNASQHEFVLEIVLDDPGKTGTNRLAGSRK